MAASPLWLTGSSPPAAQHRGVGMSSPHPQMFHRRISSVIATLGGGVTAPRWVRADDSLSYVVKDEGAGITTVRAAEYLWLSIANAIGLPAPPPVIIDDVVRGRLVIGTRREAAAVGVDQATCLAELLSGRVADGSIQLSRIFAFDLFSGNGDRHPGNYLILDDAGQRVVFAIDYSHVGIIPGTGAGGDPMVGACNTRSVFPLVSGPYGHDVAASIGIIDRLEALPTSEVDTILSLIPNDWLSIADRAGVHDWWDGPDRPNRTSAIRKGLQNGTYV